MKIRKNYFNFYVPKEWQKIIKDQEKSGLSISVYCKKNGIPVDSFYGWKGKLDPSSCTNLKEIRDKWKNLIEDWKKSGLSKTEYCKAKGIDRNSLSQWEKKFKLSPSKRTSLEKWTAIIKDWKKSGLNKANYCRKKKINPDSLYAWEKKLNVFKPFHFSPNSTNNLQSQAKSSSEDCFIPASLDTLNSNNSSLVSSKIEVTLPQGHHLILEGIFEKRKIDSWLNLLLTNEPSNKKEESTP